MSVPVGPWDPGLQNERTGLAWQRTMLSGLTCSLLIARLLADVSVLLAVAVGLAALGSTAGLGGVAIRRFRHNSVDLHSGRPIGGGISPFLVTAVLMLTGLGALVYVLLA
jgi:uncharacterized membrane protein YidH (DUF202 family)